jgi:signal transduction histidine kinase/CHASE1-domain containing sensor protein/ActR/RegA family two-component response regulator
MDIIRKASDKTVNVKEILKAENVSPGSGTTCKQAVVAILLACAGILLTILLSDAVKRSVEAEQRENFQDVAKERISLIAEHIEQYTNALNWLASFYAGSGKVERSEFREFVQSHIDTNPDIKAIGWIPRVADSDRSEYESAAQRDGLADFQFTEEQPDGTMVRRGRREEYYPAYFIEPYEGNERSMGFDVASNPAGLDTLMWSRDNDELSVSEPVFTELGKSMERSILAFKPVYRKGATHDSMEDRRENLEGFVGLEARMNSLLDEASKYSAPSGFDIYLYDVSDEESKEFLGIHVSRTRTGVDALRPEVICGEEGPELTSICSATSLNVANKKWLVVCVATPAFLAMGHTSLPLVVTIMGLALTALIIVFCLYACRRISERRQSAIRIKGHKETLEAIFHTTPVGMLLLDENFVIREANDVAGKVVDKEAIQITNKTCGSGLNCINAKRTLEGCGSSPLCSQCLLRATVEEVFSSGQGVERVQFQHTFLVDGKEDTPWLEISVEPLSIGGDSYVILVISNITEQKLAYEAKNQFLANMSHEIRTPMNAIIGFSDIMADEKLTDEQMDYVDTIRSSGKHLLRVIDDILDFSKIEAGKLELELSDCSLGEVLTSIESLAAFGAKDNGLEFRINASEDLPAQIRTDSARLTQCLINLVNNAIKFTQKGHVYVNVSLEDRNNEPYVRFDVEDTGIGIPPQKQKEIFESFTQADESHSRKYGGTGLGLAITRQLADLLGGELSLTSEEGMGSVFSLVLPAGVDVEKKANLGRLGISGDTEADKTERYKFFGRVLIAEDVKTNQVLARLLLEQMGLDVTVAPDGKDAVEKALSGEFDLIFMDIHMPVMNGYEATRALRAEGITAPIIALTGEAARGEVQEGIEAGCDDYLVKPLDRRQIFEKVRKYLPLEKQAVIKKPDSEAKGG